MFEFCSLCALITGNFMGYYIWCDFGKVSLWMFIELTLLLPGIFFATIEDSNFNAIALLNFCDLAQRENSKVEKLRINPKNLKKILSKVVSNCCILHLKNYLKLLGFLN